MIGCCLEELQIPSTHTAAAQRNRWIANNRHKSPWISRLTRSLMKYPPDEVPSTCRRLPPRNAVGSIKWDARMARPRLSEKLLYLELLTSADIFNAPAER